MFAAEITTLAAFLLETPLGDAEVVLGCVSLLIHTITVIFQTTFPAPLPKG